MVASPELDEALDRLSRTGPEFRGGLSNHGPMVAEALVRLGCADAVESWVDGYLALLDEPARPSDRITEDGWRDALGDYRRVGDWRAYFTDQLAEAPWRAVLAQWWPRLVPGMVAGATHGVIRTSQAVRGLADDEHNPQRMAELASGLAYWSARYVELPGAGPLAGEKTPAEALAALPTTAVAENGLILDQLGPLVRLPEFADGVAALRPPVAINAAFGTLTRTFADVYVHFGRNEPIGLVHAVTAPTAVRSILPHLPEVVWRPTHDALWHVGAALFAAFAQGKPRDDAPVGAPQDPAVSVANAVASGDAHAIKLAEACLREHATTGDPTYLHAASRGMYAA
ncbi:questin oxidase family protein [Fodinicola acaciae]|uniref:questin oxidase family protein n=1 Tax=Fodinicola acaciae TaxID=2681555 RepID=UPI001C9E6A87|nr:questin oxidase family protein [Fodinicola acaciae]